MEISPDALLEQAKELALTKHLLESELTRLRTAVDMKFAQVSAHAEHALSEFEAVADNDANWDGVKQRLADIVKIVKGE